MIDPEAMTNDELLAARERFETEADEHERLAYSAQEHADAAADELRSRANQELKGVRQAIAGRYGLEGGSPK